MWPLTPTQGWVLMGLVALCAYGLARLLEHIMTWLDTGIAWVSVRWRRYRQTERGVRTRRERVRAFVSKCR